MKKELLAGTKGLVTTLMVAMVVVCIFQLFSAIGNFANRNNYVLSHSVFVIAIITWILYRYSIKNYLKKCPIKIALYCPIIAISILVLLSVFGTYIYIPNLFENALTSITQNTLLCTITIGLLQPVAEEMLFRGVVLGCLLKGKTNPWIAIGISTFIFSIIHLNLTQMIGAAIFSMIAGWLFYKTRSLWPSIIIHTTNNLSCCVWSFTSLSTITYGMTKEQLLIIHILLVIICIVVLSLTIKKICVIFKRNKYGKDHRIVSFSTNGN